MKDLTTESEFYEAWSPRLNDRLRRLISMAKGAIEATETRKEDARSEAFFNDQGP